MIPVKGHNGLYRDENTNAIINLNDNGYFEYIKSKNKLLENQKRLDNLENELSEIKNLLLQLVKNK